MFLFPQNGYEGIHLPRGIDCGERKIYILAKGYVFAKLGEKSGVVFSLTGGAMPFVINSGLFEREICISKLYS